MFFALRDSLSPLTLSSPVYTELFDFLCLFLLIPKTFKLINIVYKSFLTTFFIHTELIIYLGSLESKFKMYLPLSE